MAAKPKSIRAGIPWRSTMMLLVERSPWVIASLCNLRIKAPVFRSVVWRSESETVSSRNNSIRGTPGIFCKIIRPVSGSRSYTVGTFTPERLRRISNRDSLIILRYPRRWSRSGWRHFRGLRNLRTASSPIHVPDQTSASAPKCSRSAGTKAM